MSQELQDQITGLDARLKELRNIKDRFIKAQGLEEESEKARQEIGGLEVDHQTVKEELSELQGKKAGALAPVSAGLSAAMSGALPEGRGLLEIGDDGVFLGWELGGVRRPYRGLSSGQKVTFEAALSHALLGPGPKLLIVEGGELDQEHLLATMQQLAGLPEEVQVMLMTCHRPFGKPEGWMGWKETVIS